MVPFTYFFFFKQTTAYDVTEGDWSSDVCSSDLLFFGLLRRREADDLDARSVRDVHGLHHVEILAVRRCLDEQQLGRTLVVDLVKRLVKLAELLRLAVDREIGRASCRERVSSVV